MREKLIKLPYDYDALKPEISEQVLEWHHDVHHQGYVNGVDSAEKQLEKQEMLETVKKAQQDVSEASIGFSVSESDEMKFLIDEYFGLIYSINILVRLLPLMLVFLYILLVVWLI